MIRIFQTYLPGRTVFLGVSEAAVATLAFLLTMVAAMGWLNAGLMIGYERGDARIALIVAVFILCMYYFDLYDSTVLRSPREVYTRLIQVFGSVCLILAFIYTFFPAMRFGQRIFLAGCGSAAVCILAWRRLFLYLNTVEAFRERVLVLGQGALADQITNEIQARPELGFHLVCHITEDQELGANGRPQTVAFAEELQRLVKTQSVQRIIVALGERRGRLPVDALLQLKEHGVQVQDGSELYEIITGKLQLDALRPSMLLFSPGFQLSPLFRLYKRIFSLLISLTGLVLAAPVVFLIAVAIRLDSPGPVIFRQPRVGRHGRQFTLYKFRSMYAGSHDSRPAEQNDKRFTRVGTFLRATRLDELPQLWNILIGDMHLVGPRPFVPDQEGYLVEQIPFYKLRWSVRPGATGWAQVCRGYCATVEDNSEKLAYDLFYIKHLSIGLDLLVVFKTAKTLLLGRGAR